MTSYNKAIHILSPVVFHQYLYLQNNIFCRLPHDCEKEQLRSAYIEWHKILQNQPTTDIKLEPKQK